MALSTCRFVGWWVAGYIWGIHSDLQQLGVSCDIYNIFLDSGLPVGVGGESMQFRVYHGIYIWPGTRGYIIDIGQKPQTDANCYSYLALGLSELL